MAFRLKPHRTGNSFQRIGGALQQRLGFFDANGKMKFMKRKPRLFFETDPQFPDAQAGFHGQLFRRNGIAVILFNVGDGLVDAVHVELA